MLDLALITDDDVRAKLEQLFHDTAAETDAWRIFGACLACLQHESFANTRTYPRPDHPDPRKRRSVEFLLAGIIVSLRTTLENEQKAMANVMARYADSEALMSADPLEFEALIRPAGMAKIKTTRILAALRQTSVLSDGIRTLETWPLERAREYLLALPGIGPKAADCLLTIGLGHPSMVVDVNVFRFTTHLLRLETPSNAAPKFDRPADVAAVKRHLDTIVGTDVFLCQIVHTMLLLAGRRIGRGDRAGERCVAGAPFCLSCHADGMLDLPLVPPVAAAH